MTPDYVFEQDGYIHSFFAMPTWQIAAILAAVLITGIFMGRLVWKKRPETAIAKSIKALDGRLAAFEKHVKATLARIDDVISAPQDAHRITQLKIVGDWTGDWQTEKTVFENDANDQVARRGQGSSDLKLGLGYLAYLDDAREDFPNVAAEIFDLCRTLDKARSNPGNEVKAYGGHDGVQSLRVIKGRLEKVRDQFPDTRSQIKLFDR